MTSRDDDARAKRPRHFRPEYDYYHPPPPHYPHRMPINEYWSPRPNMIPPYAIDPSMIPSPHYNPYPQSSLGYDYPYDAYGFSAYPEFRDPYQMSRWSRRGRAFPSGRGRGDKPQIPGHSPGQKPRANRNDYNQHFVDTGQRPQNFLRDAQLEDQYEDYPNAKRLVALKNSMIDQHATPPYYLKADLRVLDLSLTTFGTKFDVILIDPPWEEYVRRAPSVGDGVYWSWQEIRDLRVEDIMDSPSFVFLWCGSEEGLEAGRHCLNKWGYRRCEDIVWIKTNKGQTQKSLIATNQEARSVLQHTKEHCLMGIKGTVRRALDGHVIHANIDTDIIVSEESPLGSTEKPDQLYQIIERFCLGRRRIELFGEDHNIRPGWVTVGQKLQASNFKPSVFANHFLNPDSSPFIMNPGRPQPVPSLFGMERHESNSPPCFLILYNVSKKHNIGTLARSATAFGVREFCLVGSNKFNTFGSHGASDFVSFKHFGSLNDCCAYLTEQHDCEIVGIEIDDKAESVAEEPFTGPTAFLVGNEGSGLNAKQREVCSRLIYVPQFGAGTASLNVGVACSIVLHRFATWARYKERNKEGEKFSVGSRPIRKTSRGVAPSDTCRTVVPHPPSSDGYLSDRSNSDSASGYLSSIFN